MQCVFAISVLNSRFCFRMVPKSIPHVIKRGIKGDYPVELVHPLNGQVG